MNKNFLIILLVILLPTWAGAQHFEDAYRYSSGKIEGSARSGAMGNAFGALGNDFTGVGINPAGLGIYRTSEFSLTPGFNMTEINSSYIGNTMQENNYKPGMGNLGYVAVLNSGKNNQSGLVSVNLGIGYNRLKDFNSYAITQAFDAKSSFLDHMAENANYGEWSEYYEDLAWETYLLDKTDEGYYFSDMETARGSSQYKGHYQRKSFDRAGTMDEYTLGVGFNFNHRFYLGASLGVVDLYYKEFTTLTEKDLDGTIPYLNDFEFNQSLRTYGTGYNFKIGAIFKPINSLRIGASLATPTVLGLNDKFETGINSSVTWDDNSTEKFKKESPFSDYDYELVTPFKATLSGALVVGKKGLVSADIEYVDHSVAKLRKGGDGYDFADQNQDINEIFKAVTNFRVGGEYRLTDAFSLRAGYELYPSAFNTSAFGKDQFNAKEDYQVCSVGFGYSTGSFFVDIAYRNSGYTQFNKLYPAPLTSDYPEPQFAQFDQNTHKVLFTLGFRF